MKFYLMLYSILSVLAVASSVPAEIAEQLAELAKNATAAFAQKLSGTQAKTNLRTAATVKFSANSVLWLTHSLSCSLEPQSVVISCGAGGSISLPEGVPQGDATCVKTNSRTLTCTKPSNIEYTYIDVQCTGAYSVTATIPARTFSGCDSFESNEAYKIVGVAQRCFVSANAQTYKTVFYGNCVNAGPEYWNGDELLCGYENTNCVSTSGSTCSIFTPAISDSTGAVSKLCIV
jgi:hypothetical protein